MFAAVRISEMDRHLTVSGFVVHDGRIALHWHRKIGAWLPAGGHLEPGEDPVQATLREVREEFALETSVISTTGRVQYDGGPGQLDPPFTILECYPEPDHIHIDMVYFLNCTGGFPGRCHDPENPIQWVDEAALNAGHLPLGDAEIAIPPDVRALGLEALRLSANLAPVGGVSSPSGSTPA
jgi:8-oxo-dGTP pyrophosphatase MutT (NUDIX family)